MKSLSEFIIESTAEYVTRDGKVVDINVPTKLRGDAKAFIVYRPTNKKDDSGRTLVFAIKFGDANSTVKNDDPARVKSFWARHNCSDKTDKDTAGYWACRAPELFGKDLKLPGGNSRW